MSHQRYLAKEIEKARRKLVKDMKDVTDVEWAPNPYAETAIDVNEVMAPSSEIVFHGTQSTTTVNSILRHGFLVPGTKHPYTKSTVNVACGSVYGLGVYTTDFASTATLFSFVDDRKDLMVVVGLMTPGDVFTWPSAFSPTPTPTTCTCPTVVWKDTGKHEVWSGDETSPVGYFDTIHVPEYPCYVSANASAIRVLGTFRIRCNKAGAVVSSTLITGSVEWREAPKVDLVHVAGDTYCLTMPRPLKLETVSSVPVLHVVVPGPGSETSPLLLDEFLDGLRAEWEVWLWVDGHDRVRVSAEAPYSGSGPGSSGPGSGPTLARVMDTVASESNRFHAVVLVEATDAQVSAAWSAMDAAGYWTRPEVFSVTFHVVSLELPGVTVAQFTSHFGNVNEYADLWCTAADVIDADPETTRLGFVWGKLWERVTFQLTATAASRDGLPQSRRVCIPSGLGIVGSGFVDWPGDAAPVWDRVVPSTATAILVAGWQRAVRVDGVLWRTQVPEISLGCSDASMDRARVLLRSACALRAHCMARKGALGTLGGAGAGSGSGAGAGNKIRTSSRGATISLQAALDAMLETLHADIVKGDMPADVLHMYRSVVSAFRRIASELHTYGALAAWMPPKWIGQLASLRYGKRIAKRLLSQRAKLQAKARARSTTTTTMLEKTHVPLPAPLPLPDAAILNSSAQGVLIRVRQTSASEIDPWRVIVEYVSLNGDVKSVASTYAESVCGVSFTDSTGRMCNAVLPVSRDCPRAYFGHVFTGNPAATLPAQHFALACSTLVSFVEKCFRAKDKSALAAPGVAKLLGTLHDAVAVHVEYFRRFKDLVEYTSLVEVLAAADDGFFKGFQAFDLFVEAVCRECRAYIRFAKKDVDSVLTELFQNGGDPSTPEGRIKLVKRTGRFFSSFRATNCSPFAVVAMCAYREDPSTFLERVSSGKVNMRAFLAQHRPTWTPGAAQVSLYIYGMNRYGSARSDGVAALSTSDPAVLETILHSAWSAVTTREQHHAAAREAAKTRVEARRQRRFALAQATVLPVHTVPRLFIQNDIDELNKSRPKDNQLELAGDGTSGLLRYHCCYPDCPDFLGQSFKPSRVDEPKPSKKKTSIRRRSNVRDSRCLLFRHFAMEQEFGVYVPAFHKVARTLRMRRGTFEHFVEALDRAFANCEPYLRMSGDMKADLVKSVWSSPVW